MAILAFQKPENVIITEQQDDFAKFEFRPLEPGYGITIGNALRRILLSSLDGYAISSIRIEGVNHEFASVEGVTEDVTNIILNLKQVRFKPLEEGAEQERILIKVEGKTEFVAGDLNEKLTAFKVLNEDLHICTIDKDYSMTIELEVNKGRGYVPAQDKQDEVTELNWLAIDSIYTPIRNVKFAAEPFRVDDRTDFENLVFEITTDGSISPKSALEEAAYILIQHFALFSDKKILEDEAKDFVIENEYDEETGRVRKNLKRDLKEFDLSVRALNCLHAAEIYTLGELVTLGEDEVSKIRNFGNKSLKELKDLLAELDLSFGMDVSKYKLDKD